MEGANTAIRHREIPERIAALPIDQRTRLLNSAKNDSLEIVEALARDPAPGMTRDFALAVHRERMGRENAGLVETWKRRRAALEHAAMTLPQIRDRIGSSGHRTNGAVA